jgi:hypothetical protein
LNLQTLTKFSITETRDNWARGRIDPTWGQLHRQLDYKNKPFNDDLTLARWVHAGLRFEKYTGDLIDFKDLPEWVLPIAHQTGLSHIGASLYKMTPGCVLPTHADTYSLYKKFHNISHNRIMRIVVFLEDWQSGHYLEVEGRPITDWVAGNWIGWNYNTEHMAANLGPTDRYTMQITGVYEPE